jgi:hypothetical protein
VKSPADTAVSGPVTPKPGGDPVREWTIAVAVAYSLVLATGGGYVFYASIRPVSIPVGFADPVFDFPWVAAYLLLAAVWVAGPVVLLVLGLTGRRRQARLSWRFVAGWLSALAGGTAVGLVILRDFRQLFTAYPRDLDGTPLGPSRFAPGAPYWQALIALGGQLAVGAVVIALTGVPPRKDASGSSGDEVTRPGRRSRGS